jgi:integrase
MTQDPDLRERHSRSCNSLKGGTCNCAPSFQARVYVPEDGRRRTKTFSGPGARAAAKGWLIDARKGVRDGKLRAPTKTTLRASVDAFLEGAANGEILTRGKTPYKPAVLRQYRSAVYRHVPAELLDRRLDAISFADLERLQERLQGSGISGSTVQNVFIPLKVIFKRAKRAGVIAVKPTDDLELPIAGRADRSATPEQAAVAIAALPEDDQAVWATSFYAGLRRGELRALRVENVHETFIDIAADGGWDDLQGRQAPKSAAGVRRVPLISTLKTILDEHLERTGRTGGELVFGETATASFRPWKLSERADAAWEAVGLERWTLKDGRASFRTWLDSSPISETRADRYMGHSIVHVRGRYIVSPESQLADDARLLEAYIAGAVSGKVVPIGAVPSVAASAAAVPAAGAGSG